MTDDHRAKWPATEKVSLLVVIVLLSSATTKRKCYVTTETAASDEGVAANAAWYPRESMDRESRATPRIPDSTAEDTTTRLTETRSAQ